MTEVRQRRPKGTGSVSWRSRDNRWEVSWSEHDRRRYFASVLRDIAREALAR